MVRSTSEHPFYVSDEKYLGRWVAAGELTAGMWVLCDDGAWARVEEVSDSGEWEVVYNMRVADSHTYFVGEEGRGYAVWVHNRTSCDILEDIKTTVSTPPIDNAKLAALTAELHAIVRTDPNELPSINKTIYSGRFQYALKQADFQISMTSAEVIRADKAKLQHEFSTSSVPNPGGHAPDFGVTATTWNNAAELEFREAVIRFAIASNTIKIPGTYRGTIAVTHYYNATTQQWMCFDSNLKLVACWILGVNQAQDLASNKNVQ